MPRHLPRGTVTFLFTDVEGSTKLLHRLGDAAFADALAEHRKALRATFAAHGGIEIDTQGDAFFVAFPTATGALSAARGSVEALEAGPITVRIGVHTGTPVVTNEGYVGEDVHRAARIAASGHGGQILVSSSTASLVDAEAHSLRDLGEHRFKDLARPERVYQVGDADFPPIRSLSPSNLPVPATPFLGREDELARVGELLDERSLRVLTLTGPGGTGKTRLAIQAAAESSDRFPGGLWWVALSPIKDPALVLSEIAGSLGVEEQADTPLAETIAARTSDRRTLVVLDNAEHLLPHLATEIAPLTRNGGGASFLVTSRERLHLEAEREFPVPSMTAEDAEAFLLSRAEALGVAIERSQTLSKLAERLDRLPLAMQLAAARLKLFSVEQLLERLSTRLDLPGERDADPRQRTLRATIEWSHDLLDEDERALLWRLSVFAGGGTVPAIEAICDSDADVLLSLVDKSLVRRRDDRPEPRFSMLETIRDFAAERLAGSDETERVREAHAHWFVSWAHRWDIERRVPDRRPALERADAELDNVRSALGWAEERSDGTVLQGIVGGLRLYWQVRGLYREGRRWLDLAYRHPAAAPTLLVLVLDGLTSVAYRQGEYDVALRVAEEAMPLAAATGSPHEVMSATTNLGNALAARGRVDDAIAAYHEVVALAREDGNELWLMSSLVNLGDAASIAGRYEEAESYLREGLEIGRMQAHADVTVALIDLATVAFHLHQDDDAIAYARRSAELSEISDFDAIALLLFAGVANRQGDTLAAARLLGASESVRASSGYQFEPNEQNVLATITAEMGDAVGDADAQAAYRAGRALEPDAAKALIKG